MAGVPRNLPLPRGSLSLGLAEFFANQVATSAAQVTSGVGNYANVGLFNGSAYGHLMYVVGCTIWNSDSTGAVILRRLQGGIGSGTVVEPAQLNPFTAKTSGQIYINDNGITGDGLAVWSFSGGGYPTDWPYDSPLAILPAGWHIYTDPPNPSSTVAASFRWFVVPHG